MFQSVLNGSADQENVHLLLDTAIYWYYEYI